MFQQHQKHWSQYCFGANMRKKCKVHKMKVEEPVRFTLLATTV